ncbi:MAG: GNAT family N-acetyltransferase [Bacteroidota bacterium]
MLRIRPIEQSEIPQLQNFPPEDWNLDLPRLLSFHFGYPYFYPAAAEVDKKIIGCGIAIVHGTISWLGTIIVLPEYRKRGIGKEITSHLIQYCKDRGCTTQLLTASAMGESVYRKLGFHTSAEYVFYKRESIVPIQRISNVREVRQEDVKYIKELDREITGEERFTFLERFLSTGWVYVPEKSTRISGIYLPNFGSGLIMTKDSKSGFELMKLRFNRGKTTAVVPSMNTIARKYLLSEGFQEYRTAPRMVLGQDVNWNPTMLYNRATGYCG